ncbi:MAG TPA: SDR family oxidoreductase, partial [Planctomycetota bacterium]
ARNPQGSAGLQELQAAHGAALRCLACDVGDDAAVAHAAATVGKAGGFDLLLNNAGISRGRRAGVDQVDLEDMRRCFEINALGPLRVARALHATLAKGTRPRLVNMTSLMGSIADNSSGGSYAYRTSKTALNMITRNLAHDLGPGLVVAALHPGWVRTDMGGKSAPLAIDAAVAAMIATIDGLGSAHSGAFLDRDGATLPW